MVADTLATLSWPFLPGLRAVRYNISFSTESFFTLATDFAEKVALLAV